MRVVFVLFDSLNRLTLGCHGGSVVKTPNFDRLAERSVTFDTHYVGSLPCIPARRDMLTGRLSFLHRSWGPIEPYDITFPELLGQAGVYCHLVTDHFHYWEDGGATFHNRYDSYEFFRGQEGDPWMGLAAPPWDELRQRYHPVQFTERARTKYKRRMLNDMLIKEDADFPIQKCFRAGLDFLERNREADNWLLHLETFDPHEPFFAPARLRDGHATNYAGPILDWPPYARVTEAPDECAELRANYCATVAHCDEMMGSILDFFDTHDLWPDTALIVTTDHGFLLGEHDWWAKIYMPCYEEVAHIPLWIHHPEAAEHAGTRRRSLTQTIDVAPTVLAMFGVDQPAEMWSHSLMGVLARDEPVRDAGLYGLFGSAVNVTDGRYTYFRYPPDVQGGGNLNQYTLMPMHMAVMFSVEELRAASLAGPFAFTQGVPLLRVPSTPDSPFYLKHGPGVQHDTATVLFDLSVDPHQTKPIEDAAVEAQLTDTIVALMEANDAPPEAYARFDLNAPKSGA